MKNELLSAKDRAVIRTDLDAILVKVSEVLAEVDEFRIETQDEYEMSAELLRRIKGAEKRIEDWRTATVRPLNSIVSEFNALAKEHTNPLLGAERKIKAAVSDFVLERERERKRLQAIEDEKRVKALAEAQEVRRLQLEEAASLAADPDPVAQETASDLRAAAEVLPVELAAPPVPVKTYEKASGISLQEVFVPEFDCPSTFGVLELQKAVEAAINITNGVPTIDPVAAKVNSLLREAFAACVPAAYLNISPRLGELKTLAKNSGGNAAVPGVQWKSESVVSARAR